MRIPSACYHIYKTIWLCINLMSISIMENVGVCACVYFIIQWLSVRLSIIIIWPVHEI